MISRGNGAKHWFLLALGLVAIVIVVNLAPIPQDPGYHAFADGRTLLSVPNFGNVVSNTGFLLVGAIGLIGTLFGGYSIGSGNKTPSAIFFCGIALVGIGSSYYHLAPSNETLAWDRLPMTIAFMALFAIVVGQFVSARWGKMLLFPLLLVGAASVFYWRFTEFAGQGDLRPYVLVQFLPMLLIPTILLLYRSNPSAKKGYWLMIGGYAIAKACEHFDREIYSLLGFVSGHSLKHVLAALAVCALLIRFRGDARHSA